MRALLFLILASCAHWTGGDTVREIAYGTTVALDWGQTEKIVAQCSELNPLIGPCGGRMAPQSYFPGMLIVHAIVSAVLPRDWRDAWQYLTIGQEAGTVYTNWREGWSP